MTRLQSLIAVRDAVKAGVLPPGASRLALGADPLPALAVAAFYDDMNAALSLLPAVLPGWRVRLDIGRRNRAWMNMPPPPPAHFSSPSSRP